ncbi:MAG: LysE family translocator [Calothrix sp. MO_192.B10]|nr:LysE family translocator [Calothrix sp. MO_192.B10]
MTIFDVSALFVIMVTLAMLPSTSVALVVTRSATLGFLNGAAVSIGIVLGDLIFALLAIFGLTALSGLMGALFLVIKYIAGAYLIWFGVTLLTNRTSTNLHANSSSPSGGLTTSFFAGFFVTLSDVKAILFYGSLFPTFVDMSALSMTDILVITLVILITVGGVKLMYAFGAKKLVSMSKGLKIEKEAKLAAGSLMVGAGTYLIVKA